jgi:hypothetical protein
VAARLMEPHATGCATRLLKRAMELAGETPTLLGLLHGIKLASEDLEGAALLEDKLMSFSSGEELQDRIDEYLRLHNTIAADQRRKGIIAMSWLDSVKRCLELEEWLNRYWLSQPESTRAQAVSERRFVAGGSMLWVSMFRDAKDYASAVERLEAVTADWPLLRLRHAANQPTVEGLLNNGMGACLDSPTPGHLEVAVGILDRTEREWPEPQLDDLLYNAACVRARQGRVDAALAYVRRAKKRGVDVGVMAADTDLAGLRDEPRFIRLVGRVGS